MPQCHRRPRIGRLGGELGHEQSSPVVLGMSPNVPIEQGLCLIEPFLSRQGTNGIEVGGPQERAPDSQCGDPAEGYHQHEHDQNPLREPTFHR
jgi:hypothetical protein